MVLIPGQRTWGPEALGPGGSLCLVLPHRSTWSPHTASPPCPRIGCLDLTFTTAWIYYSPHLSPHATVIVFCCCSVTQLCPALCDPMNCSKPGFPVLHHLLELAQPHVHWVSFSISPSNEYSELISFRTDWLDLLAVQGTVKSLLQCHNSKASFGKAEIETQT